MAKKTKKPMCPKHCCYYQNCGCTQPPTTEEIVLKALDKMKDPYAMRKKTYVKLLELCGNDKKTLNRLIIKSTGERVQGLVL